MISKKNNTQLDRQCFSPSRKYTTPVTCNSPHKIKEIVLITSAIYLEQTIKRKIHNCGAPHFAMIQFYEYLVELASNTTV